MQKWYMVGTYEIARCKVGGARKIFPHVVRFGVVTTLQRMPTRPGQSEFILSPNEHVINADA